MQAEADDTGADRRNVDADLHQTVIDQIELQKQRRSHEKPGQKANRQGPEPRGVKQHERKADAEGKAQYA